MKNNKKDNVSSIKNNSVTLIRENGIFETAIRYIKNDSIVYETTVSKGEISDQKNTGECWIYAGCNFLRNFLIRRGINYLTLSASYISYYDKLEKSNFFIEKMIELIDNSYDDRLVTFYLNNPCQDAGQWDLFVNIVKKYGVVPTYAMPETFSSFSTSQMNIFIASKLRECTSVLRVSWHKNKNMCELKQIKKQYLQYIRRILNLCLGEPPRVFAINGRKIELTGIEFYQQYIGIDLNQYISLINAPTADKQFYEIYTLPGIQNCISGKQITYINVPMNEIRYSVIRQLSEAEPVWFGCDASKMKMNDVGIMDVDIYDFEHTLGLNFSMSKGDGLVYRHSSMNHAMIILGVNKNHSWWLVEDSHGEKCGKNGYFDMSDAWFENYVYQVVVKKEFISERVKKNLFKTPIKLPPWDPMGTLA